MGLGRSIRKIVKGLTPVIGSAAGMFFGGPIGSIMGGALMGSTTRGGHNKLKGATQGALTGAAYSAIAPMVGEALGVSPYGGFASNITGLSSPSLLNQLGISSAPGIGGGLGLLGNIGTSGLLESLSPAAAGGLGMLSDIGQHTANLLQNKRAEHYVPGQDQMNELDENLMPHHEMRHTGHGGHGKLHTYQDIASKDPYALQGKDVNSLALLSQLRPRDKKKSLHESLTEELTRLAPKIKIPGRSIGIKQSTQINPKYSKGGPVRQSNGYIRYGNTGGQADDVRMDIPKGAYVMNATDVSLYGDGNTENGARKLVNFEEKAIRKQLSKGGRSHSMSTFLPHNPTIKAWVSNGEYVFSPKTVEALGNGNNEKGAKVIDSMRINLRKHKGVKKILPPKSKDLFSYLPKSHRMN